MRPYMGALLLAVVTMLFVDAISYAIPAGIAWITDNVYARMGEESAVKDLLIVTSLLLGAGIVRGIFAHVMIRAYWYAGEAVVKDLRNALYAKLQRLDLAFYDRARVGDIMSRVTTDIQLVRNFIAYGIEHRIRIVIISLSILALMLLQDFRLAIAVYTLVPLLFLIIVWTSGKMKTAVVRKQEQLGRLASRIQENLTGIRVVKAFAMEEGEMDQFDRENRKQKALDIGLSMLAVNLNSVLMTANGAGSLVILIVGGFQVIAGTMSLGVLLAFVSYLGIMGFPIAMLAFNTSIINQAKGAAVRIFELLESPARAECCAGTHKKKLDGEIAFRNVVFGYDSENPVLRNLTFTIKPGEKVALFGLTGAGKSTLISLIPGFYLPTSGTIKIDGRDIAEWDFARLRAQTGIVLQETFLFSATIRENIAFGRPGASMTEVTNAARHAHIHDYIESLPDGYETRVGEYGIGLSGGQKQRIAIARTLLQDPAILILDDCTSSLDTVTERKIQRQLVRLMEGRTTIIVAQRMSSLAMAERIIVMKGGEIEDIDSHARLIGRNGLYRSTYLSQAGNPEGPGEW